MKTQNCAERPSTDPAGFPDLCDRLHRSGSRFQYFAYPVEGFDVPRRGPVRLLRTGGAPLRMTALPRRQLAELRDAAQELGRPSA